MSSLAIVGVASCRQREEFHPVDDRTDRPDATRRGRVESPLPSELPTGVTEIVLFSYRQDKNRTIFRSLIVRRVLFSDQR
jgi:hypothetical protein